MTELSRLSALLGRPVTVRKIRTNPFALSVSLEGLRIQERDGSAFLGWERLYVNVQASSAFTRTLRFAAIELDRPFGRLVVLKDGRLSYGGSQRWSDSPVLRGYGCGVIAALDLLLYLARQRTDCRWLTVSSWGHPYRLSREEFDAYRREASASLLCTILDVREK